MVTLIEKIENASKTDLDDLLVNEINETLKCIRGLLTESKPYARVLAFGVSKRRAQKPTAKQITDHEKNAVHKFLDSVRRKDVDFWNPNFQNTFSSSKLETLSSPAAFSCLLCFLLPEVELHHKILHRFARIVIRKLSDGGHKIEAFAHLIHPFLPLPESQVEKILKRLSKVGGRYLKLAEVLGGLQTLFFLPHKPAPSHWERISTLTFEDPVLWQLEQERIGEISAPYQELAETLVEYGASLVPKPLTWLKPDVQVNSYVPSRQPRLSQLEALEAEHHGRVSTRPFEILSTWQGQNSRQSASSFPAKQTAYHFSPKTSLQVSQGNNAVSFERSVALSRGSVDVSRRVNIQKEHDEGFGMLDAFASPPNAYNSLCQSNP